MCALSSTPSKSSRMMKLTTPVIASEPYTADDPPVTTSVRATSAVGIVLRSVTCSGPKIAKRRPLTSTRFRCAPKPRRFTSAVPPGTVLALAPPLVEATNCDDELSRLLNIDRARKPKLFRIDHLHRRRGAEAVARDARAGHIDHLIVSFGAWRWRRLRNCGRSCAQGEPRDQNAGAAQWCARNFPEIPCMLPSWQLSRWRRCEIVGLGLSGARPLRPNHSIVSRLKRSSSIIQMSVRDL